MFFAKFAFVAARVVELFDFVMSVLAIRIIAGVSGGFLAFDVVIFFESGPSIIFGVVVVKAGIFIVAI